jgi:hypothetical protein
MKSLALYARHFRIINEAVRVKLTRKPNGVALEVEFKRLSRALSPGYRLDSAKAGWRQ